MTPIESENVNNEQAITDTYDPEKATMEQENFPELGNETITGEETDSSDLETEPLDDGDGDLTKENDD
jgi:hypothetical protein